VHNSGWLQTPGADVLADPAQVPRLESYVKGVVGAFADDKRILAWDLWNEPDNGSDSAKDEPNNKSQIVWVCCRRSSPGRGRCTRHSR
jgi:hypothetical protein